MKKLKSKMIFLIILLLVLFGLAENSLAATDSFIKRLGEYDASEEGFSLVEAYDKSGYVVAGYSTGYGTGSGGFMTASEHDILLIKFDTNGNHLWSRTFGIAGYLDIANELIATADGYVLAGTTAGFGAGGNDMIVLKYNISGDLIWAKTLGSSGSEGGGFIALANDGGYLALGSTNTYTVGGTDILLAKFSPSGNLVWNKVIGGGSDDSGGGLWVDSNGDIVINGATASFGVSANDVFVVKLNSTGNLIWAKTYGSPRGEGSSNVISSGDGGYLVAGGGNIFSAEDSDTHFTKLDNNGNIVWSKTIGSSFNESGAIPVRTRDGNFALGGWTMGGLGAVDNDMFINKVDSAGNILWSKIIGLPGNSVTKDMIKGFIQASDGSYVMTGESVNPYMPDVPLVKVGEDGSSCLGQSVSPTIRDITSSISVGTVTPTIASPNFLITTPSNPVITSPLPNITIICQNITCTSFTYSDWGACQPNNTQTRTITSSSPAGCTGGTPEALSQPCVYDTTPPVRSNSSPSGFLPSGTNQTNISLNTDEPATCRYSTSPGTAYSLMVDSFSVTDGGKNHSALVSGLQDNQTYNYYIRCNDTSGKYNPDDFNISFAISASCIHKSDNNPCDGCVSDTELFAFIDRWKISNADVTLKELIEAVGLWKSGCSG